MKAEDEAYAEMVRIVMGVLTEEEESEKIDCGNIPTVAIRIVGAIKGERWLINEGEVREITGLVWREPYDDASPGVALYKVVTKDDSARYPLCAWCESPYATSEEWAKFNVCRRCYTNGPT